MAQGGKEEMTPRVSATVSLTKDEIVHLYFGCPTAFDPPFIDGFVRSPSAAFRFIPCPVKLKAAISRDMGYRSCLKTVTSNKENI